MKFYVRTKALLILMDMGNRLQVTCIFLLAIINIFLFWPANLYFLNDDLLHIPLTDAGQFFQTNSVRPLHELLVKLELALWNRSAIGFHCTTLVLHFIVCLQLYNLTRVIYMRFKADEKQSAFAASLAVILFLLYPQHAESLGWILGRGPLLSGVFYLATIRLFLVNTFTWNVYVLGAIFFAGALFTYEQGILLPLVFLLYTRFQKNSKTAKLAYCFISIAVAFMYVVARLLITAEVIGTYEGRNIKSHDLLVVTANATRLILRLFINPADPTAFIILSVIFVLLILATVFYCNRKGIRFQKKATLLFTVLIVAFIAPMTSLGIPVTSFESGRFLYLPSIFLMIGLSAAIVSVYYQYSDLRTGLTVLLLITCCYWLSGKHQASQSYLSASTYAFSLHTKIKQHFISSSDTLHIDTLRGSIRRIPVFRLGFRTGIKWLYPNIDTNRIVVDYYRDDAAMKLR